MRKAFLHVYTRLSKSESDEVRSTLRFLTGRNSASGALSSLFRSAVGEDPGRGSAAAAESKVAAGERSPDKEESQYIDSVVKLLNASLPQDGHSQQNIRRHYDLFYGQLKHILDQSAGAAAAGGAVAGSRGPRDLAPGASDSSEELYNKLMMLQLTEAFTISAASKIVLARQFRHFDQLMANIAVFPPLARLELALLVFYRTADPQISSQYYKGWIKSFCKFPPAIQRVFWRGLYGRGDASKRTHGIDAAIAGIRDWEPAHTVAMYQALFETAHLLPQPAELSRNQGLFVAVLRVLAPHKQLKKYAVRVVKLSMETKLGGESAAQANVMSHYKFVTSLDTILHEIYNSPKLHGPQHSELMAELDDIFKTISSEEQDVKSRMALRYT